MARILVVDDEPDVRELFNITLKMAGHATDTAKDGVEAIERLGVELPDLILLDLMMPRLDGFGFLTHIRQHMDTKPMRVLIATAKVLEESDHEKLAPWPVVGVLNKGELDIAAMVGIISQALSHEPMKKAVVEAPKEEGEKPAESPKAAEPAPLTETASPAGAAVDKELVPQKELATQTQQPAEKEKAPAPGVAIDSKDDGKAPEAAPLLGGPAVSVLPALPDGGSPKQEEGSAKKD